MPTIRHIRFFEFPGSAAPPTARGERPVLQWIDHGRPFGVPRDVWDRARPVKTWKVSTGEAPVRGHIRILTDQDADWCPEPGRPCRLVWG
jgi:hypothetical protein